MTIALKIRKVGNSFGLVLPKEMLTRLNVGEGDCLYVTESPDNGYRLTVDDAEFSRDMEAASDIARRYRDALRELAK